MQAHVENGAQASHASRDILVEPASIPEEFSPKATVMDAEALSRALTRIAHEILEGNGGADNLAIVGIVTRGQNLAEELAMRIEQIEGKPVLLGTLDISLYRDDFGTRIAPVLHATRLPFALEGKTVVLVDDVLYTGRTIRAALDALMDYGRPDIVRLAVICDRGHRELPIRADYIGKNIPSARNETVHVALKELDGHSAVEIWDSKVWAAAKAARAEVAKQRPVKLTPQGA
ncbi:MAG: bifunctional pyr operon transcriptional regulator/uracil phosphoribosyltransferase PyrR [Coriobacteriales bacterium]|nr:bifunctional pyr operon transcriptional regulator/uracil phosphoribosyltransferase PyrR [Coriobacteriales bacterium]